MSMLNSPHFLRSVLAFDAVVCLSSVPALLGFAGPLAAMTGLPPVALQAVAVVNLLFGALIAFVASRADIPHRGVLLIVVLNAVWGIDSIIFALSGWLPLTTFGQYAVIGQGVAALVAAGLEYLGLRRQPASQVMA